MEIRLANKNDAASLFEMNERFNGAGSRSIDSSETIVKNRYSRYIR